MKKDTDESTKKFKSDLLEGDPEVLNYTNAKLYLESKGIDTKGLEKVRQLNRKQLLKQGLIFPETEEELRIFDEAHKDFEYKLKPEDIDPHEIMKQINAQ